MKVLFSVAILANAALIFWVELLFGKRLLPALGGSPAVWNTCLMFYQVVLLAGYTYVLLLDRLSPTRQVAAHACVLALAVAGLPWTLFLWSDPAGAAPIPWLLGLLALSVGPPFFALAAGAPLLQRWFSFSGHGDRGDPYFLYAASNLGSFVALGAYPLVAEPLLTLDQQTVLWKASFAGVTLLVLACGMTMLRGRAVTTMPVAEGPPEPLTKERRLYWTLLAFVPSSLLLGVTTHITSEIAPVPLLWVVPLALYLLSFVIAFGPGRSRPVTDGAQRNARGWKVWLLIGLGGAAIGLGLFGGVLDRGWLLIAADLAVLLAAGLLCHTRLARDRPGPGRLSEFYLWLALGGALGGVFNTLVAPLAFEDPLEYPLGLALFAFLTSVGAGRFKESVRAIDLALGVVPGLVALGLFFVARAIEVDPRLLFPIAGIACLAVAGRPARFGLGVAGLVLVGFALPTQEGLVILKERTFYGIHRVYWDRERRWLAHGTTVHGGQDVGEPGVPLTYYHPAGPAGSLFRSFYLRGPDPGRDRVAVVGLGTGSLLAYARPGQSWTFYELDPTVLRIAADPVFFTYLRDSLAPHRTVLGDARLALAREPEPFDLIVIDAFSSDAIPVHLLTREAIQMYLAHLRGGGWIAFHTSNRYADFSDVLANLAGDLGLVGYQGVDELGDPVAGRYPSSWVLLARTPVDLEDPAWTALGPPSGRGWTDGYSSLFEVLR